MRKAVGILSAVLAGLVLTPALLFLLTRTMGSGLDFPLAQAALPYQLAVAAVLALIAVFLLRPKKRKL